jgi:ribosomal protein L7/L12
MVFPKARLVVAALLFVGWIAYLAYLAAVASDPIVLSRPQILVANLCVLAKIEEDEGRPAPRARVTEVLWSAQDAPELLDTTLDLGELTDLGKPQGWSGPGIYLLPLTRLRKDKESRYSLTALPPVPGFYPTLTVELRDAGQLTPLVARRLYELLGLELERAKELIEMLPPLVLKRFVPRDAALQLQDDLGKLGAEVRLFAYEARIYRATDDVLRQFRELKPVE